MTCLPGIGGIVLCGGQSSRMGRSKAWLPFRDEAGDEVLLQRVVRTLEAVVAPIVVVAAPGQELPSLPPAVLIARDARESQGPIGGIAAGMAALHGLATAAYVSACDVPLLQAAVVRRICEQLGTADIALPVAPDFSHPLAAVYRLTLAPRAQELLDAGTLRAMLLCERASVHKIPVETLRDLDPELNSFRGANTPEEFEALVRRAQM